MPRQVLTAPLLPECPLHTRLPGKNHITSPATHLQARNVRLVCQHVPPIEVWFPPPPRRWIFFKPLCKSINHVIHLPSTRGSSWSHPSCVAQIWNVRETHCIRSISELPVKGFSTHSFVLVFSGASQEGPAPHQQITGRTRELGGKTTSL